MACDLWIVDFALDRDHDSPSSPLTTSQFTLIIYGLRTESETELSNVILRDSILAGDPHSIETYIGVPFKSR